LSAHAHRDAPRLGWALGLALSLAVVEVAGGIAAHSLALLSDAAHVFMDAAALGIALVANVHAARPATDRHTFGYARLEVLAALANGALLLGVTVLIAVEAVHRFSVPAHPNGALMAGVAAAGLCANAVIGLMLVRGARDNVNVKAALFHVAGDAVGAFAVIVGGLAVLAGGGAWIDPALALFVALIIVAGVARIFRETADVLLESAPSHVEVPRVRKRMQELAGVVDVHDLHVWTIGPGSHALAAHVLLADARISEASAILRAIEERLRGEFAISHVTLQFECEACAEDARVICTQTS